MLYSIPKRSKDDRAPGGRCGLSERPESKLREKANAAIYSQLLTVALTAGRAVVTAPLNGEAAEVWRPDMSAACSALTPAV